MNELLDRLTALFSATYGNAPDIITRAPGRVNLIGEHTDYNDGFVLPIAIDKATYVAARRRADSVINIVAGDLGNARSSFAIDVPICVDAVAPWSNYIRGVVAGLQAHGVPVSGADVAILGEVPQGAGLSSSASLEVAIGYALTQLAGKTIDRTTLAQIGQRAEHDYAGCQCGVMDQLISARGQGGHALLIDCRSLETHAIKVPDGAAVMIIHSGQTRGLVDGKYNERRAQCNAAVAHYGIVALRDLDVDRLEAGKAGLDALSFIRARHVVTENARTLEAAACLERNDLARLGVLMAESHVSMRDDFEITTPILDGLVVQLQSLIGSQGGARMTGGGFGGAIVAVMPQSIVGPVKSAIMAHYRTPAGDLPLILTAAPSDGVSKISGDLR